MEIASADPVSFRVVGDEAFQGTGKPAPMSSYTEAARAVVVGAIRGFAEFPHQPVMQIRTAGKRAAGTWPADAGVILDQFRRLIFREVTRTIKAGGFDALQDLASGQRVPHPPEAFHDFDRPLDDGGAGDDLFEEEGIESQPEGALASTSIDPLRGGWEDCPIPPEILLKRAVKYVFSPSWTIGLSPVDQGGLFVESCRRFRVHALGAKLNNEDDRARTAAYRAVELLVKGDPLDLSSRLPGLSGKWPADPGEQQECLPALREHLFAEMVRAVENNGYAGLLKFSSAGEVHPPR